MGWFGDKAEDILDGIGDKINDLFRDSGDWCADVLDTGTKYYNKFIAFAYELVTKDIKDGAFQQFWDVIDFMNSVFVVIASTMLVMMFFYTLYESSMETRTEVSMWRTVFDYIKLLIANVLIANSLNIVIAIFKFGTNIAVYAIRTTAGNAIIANKDAGITDGDRMMFERGVSGLSGFFVFIIAIIGAVVMIASAAMIIMEIFKRFFKIFTLIPFASLSFATVMLPDNKGGEMFRGYIKNVLATAIESAIIVFCLVVSSSLISSGSTNNNLMGELFELNSEELYYKEIYLETEDDVKEFKAFCRSTIYFDKKPTGSQFDYLEDFDNYRIIPEEIVYDSSVTDKPEDFKEWFSSLFKVEAPATGYVSRELGMGSALLLVVRCILPMILTAAVIKEVPSFASKAIGM